MDGCKEFIGIAQQCYNEGHLELKYLKAIEQLENRPDALLLFANTLLVHFRRLNALNESGKETAHEITANIVQALEDLRG